jgi:hypothetical protein
MFISGMKGNRFHPLPVVHCKLLARSFLKAFFAANIYYLIAEKPLPSSSVDLIRHIRWL